ncbi:MAG: CoA pyrophosphatase [Deltaproteobacteria bacterium]|nr:CoA pyrophosphatase [Deltaproteobacteria bacterium]
MLSLDEIRDRMKDRPAILAEPRERGRAAVALVVCDEGSGPEVLFIERSDHDEDPWSGHLGFPGGRVEPEDPSPRSTAARETREELGLDLASAEYLGRLDDLLGAHVPVVVSCFAFGFRRRPELSPNPTEVRQAFWFPLEDLRDPRRHSAKTFHFLGEELTHPAIRVLGEGRPWLWGITYRLIVQFLEALGCPV